MRILLAFLVAAGFLQAQSTEREIAIGQSLSANIEKQYAVIEDASLQSYYSQLVNEVARPARLPFPIKLRLIEFNQRKSIVLPGGFLYVSSGGLDSARTRADMAALFAHDVAHLKLGPIEMPAHNSVSIGKIFIAGEDGLCVRFSGLSLLPTAWRRGLSSREDEADRRAAGYLSSAGYDPKAVSEFFGR